MAYPAASEPAINATSESGQTKSIDTCRASKRARHRHDDVIAERDVNEVDAAYPSVATRRKMGADRKSEMKPPPWKRSSNQRDVHHARHRAPREDVNELYVLLAEHPGAHE